MRKSALACIPVLMLTCVPASADSLTATVTAIDPATGVIELSDKSKLTTDAKVVVEGKIDVGSVLYIEFNGTENGYEPLQLVRVMNPKSAKPRIN